MIERNNTLKRMSKSYHCILPTYFSIDKIAHSMYANTTVESKDKFGDWKFHLCCSIIAVHKFTLKKNTTTNFTLKFYLLFRCFYTSTFPFWMIVFIVMSILYSFTVVTYFKT